MNTFKSIKYLSVAVLLSAWGCSSTKQLTTKGEYDDTYGSSKDAPQIAYTPRQTPEYIENQRYQPEEPQQSQENATGTDEYYDENYLNSRKVYRNNNGDAGYDSGFANGYQSGWNDYAWSQPVGWTSPFNRFGYGNGYLGGYGSSYWGSGFGLSLGFGNFNRFYDPFWGGGSYGFNSFYSPFNSWYSPFGYSSWYSPYSSFYSPYSYYSYGYYDPYRYGYGNSYYVNNYYNNITSGVSGVSNNRVGRTYGPRDGGSGSNTYNRGFTNAAVNNGSNSPDGRRSANYGSRSTNGTEYARPSRNGEWNGSAASNDYNRGNSRSYGGSSSANDTYYARPRRNGGTDGGSYSNSGSSNGSSNGGYNYSRPSTSSRSSDSWSSGSGNSSRNSGWSNSNSNSGYSRGSSTPSSSSWGNSSSSSSYGGSSSSSSSHSSGGGGSSRGPR